LAEPSAFAPNSAINSSAVIDGSGISQPFVPIARVKV
jgi:hypothetical protein